MASRRRNTICVLFDKVPDGTHYKKGTYSWVNEPEALEYIDKGIGSEYDPDKKAKPPKKKEPKKTLKPKDDKK